MKHVESIQKVINGATKAREELYLAILNLPKNDDKVMERVGKNAYTINMSTIAKNDTVLSPYYYIFEEQYEMIVSVLKNTQMHRVIPAIEEMIKTKIVISGNNRNKLHPKVVGYLKELIK